MTVKYHVECNQLGNNVCFCTSEIIEGDVEVTRSLHSPANFIIPRAEETGTKEANSRSHCITNDFHPST